MTPIEIRKENARREREEARARDREEARQRRRALPPRQPAPAEHRAKLDEIKARLAKKGPIEP